MAGLEIIVGTYEQFTISYRVESLPNDPTRLKLKKGFAAHMHTASVRAIAAKGKYVATGGSDERVCLLDIKDGTKKIEFVHHEGNVNALAFSNDGSILLTGGNDGAMTAINTDKLTVIKTWKDAHKGAVQSISIHPQGKMVLTIGRDMEVKTWNLVTGRLMFTTGLRKKGKYERAITDIQWSPDGKLFALLANSAVEVISIKTTRAIWTMESSSATSMCWISDSELAVGLETGALLFANINVQEQQDELQLYKCRLKAMAVYGNYIATASSEGEVSLWHLDDVSFKQVCTQQIGCRPICLTLVEAGMPQPGEEAPEELVTEDAQAVNRAESANSIAGRMAKDLAWVSVEMEDPIQQVVSIRTRKQAVERRLVNKRRDVMVEKTTKNKRSNEFIEEETNDAIRPSTSDVPKKNSAEVCRNLKRKAKTVIIKK